MNNKVKETIIEHKLINENDNILVGVSGGADSMTLLYILRDIQKALSYNLFAAHVNHGIRGEDADGDEQYVRRHCSKLNIPFFSTKLNMDEYAKKHKLSSEEAGREIRYKYFRKVLLEIGGGKIAVAHNKNDQAETVIMRFLRGTGLDGLKGMEYYNKDIIRPLLDINREEIEKYCADKNLNPRVDKTNFEPIYGRNKIRLELIPYIQENFNRAIIDTLNRTSKLVQNDNDFLNIYVQEAFKRIKIEHKKDSLVLSNNQLLKLHPSIKSRVLRYSIEKILGHLKGIEEKHILSIINLSITKNTGKSIDISNNVTVRLSYDNLIIERQLNSKANLDFEVKLNKIGSTYIQPLNKEIVIDVVEEKDIISNSRFIKLFDYDKIKGSLIVRNRKAGDTFTPLGMEGKKKIKDFFIDEKISRDERDKIPLIVDDKEILWIVGYRINNKYKVTKNTKKILIIKYQ